MKLQLSSYRSRSNHDVDERHSNPLITPACQKGNFAWPVLLGLRPGGTICSPEGLMYSSTEYSPKSIISVPLPENPELKRFVSGLLWVLSATTDSSCKRRLQAPTMIQIDSDPTHYLPSEVGGDLSHSSVL